MAKPKSFTSVSIWMYDDLQIATSHFDSAGWDDNGKLVRFYKIYLGHDNAIITPSYENLIALRDAAQKLIDEFKVENIDAINA